MRAETASTGLCVVDADTQRSQSKVTGWKQTQVALFLEENSPLTAYGSHASRTAVKAILKRADPPCALEHSSRRWRHLPSIR